MKIAIVHDWILGMRGGEKVLEALCELFPDADLFTLIHKKGSGSEIIEKRNIHTSFMNRLPFATKLYKHYNIFSPFAIEQFDLSEYDLVISSSHQAAKGVITGPDTLHISYIHTPVRYYWDQYYEYFSRWPRIIKPFIALVGTFFRMWDISNTNRVDHIFANSQFVARRIKKFYNRESEVIYPPVNTTRFGKIPHIADDYYIMVSALTPNKKIDIAIEACNMSKRKLKIIGKGMDEGLLKKMAGSTVEILTNINDEELDSLYTKAKGFIFTSVEDFGIAPVEAMAAGIPVIAYAKGGALETVINGKTGIFFHEPSPQNLIDALTRFEQMKWNRQEIKEHGASFAKERFMNEVASAINRYLGYDIKVQIQEPVLISQQRKHTAS